MCHPSHWDLLAFHQRKDLILLDIREDRKVHTLEDMRATWLLEVHRGALSQERLSPHQSVGRVCQRDLQWLVNNLASTRLVQNLLNVDLLKPSAVGSLDIRSPGGFYPIKSFMLVAEKEKGQR
jgi:hypothetical protein